MATLAKKKSIYADVQAEHSVTEVTLGSYIDVLELSPNYFNNDLDLFGHVFENMVLRDLLVYAQAHGARVLHDADSNGLEADAVYQLADGRYALIEIKTGSNAIPAAEANLLKFREVIREHNSDTDWLSKGLMMTRLC